MSSELFKLVNTEKDFHIEYIDGTLIGLYGTNKAFEYVENTIMVSIIDDWDEADDISYNLLSHLQTFIESNKEEILKRIKKQEMLFNEQKQRS